MSLTIKEIKKILDNNNTQENLLDIKRKIAIDGKPVELLPKYDEILEDIKDIDNIICKGNTIMEMSNTQIQSLLQVREEEKKILLRKIEYLVTEINKTDSHIKYWSELAKKQQNIIKEEKEKMQKIINIVKVIAYVISIVLPLLDGVKGVTSKVTEIYKEQGA